MDAKQTYSLVDQLVAVDAQIKALEKTKESLKEQIISLGEGTHPGHSGSVSVVLQNRKNLDKELVKAALGDEAKFEACYVTGSSIVVRVTPFAKAA